MPAAMASHPKSAIMLRPPCCRPPEAALRNANPCSRFDALPAGRRESGRWRQRLDGEPSPIPYANANAPPDNSTHTAPGKSGVRAARHVAIELREIPEVWQVKLGWGDGSARCARLRSG